MQHSAAAERVLQGQIEWPFWPKQADVMESDHPRQNYAGAFAAGKTYVGGRKIIRDTLENHHSIPSLVCEPTYKMCLRIAQREINTALTEAGIRCRVITSPTNMAIYFDRPERCIWFESGDDPLNISGTTVGAIWHDEPAIVVEEVHRRLASRLRDRNANSRHLKTGTHEGLGWFHKLTQKRRNGDLWWQTTAATLYDNGSLTQDFIDSQLADFDDPVLHRMYIMGIATASSGAIYGTRVQPHHLLACDPRIGQVITAWDFNVHHMTTLLGVLLPGPTVHWFSEVVTATPMGTTTDEHAQRVIERLSQLGVAYARKDGSGNKIVVGLNGAPVHAYIDASGKNKHPSASFTDEAHLKIAGFKIFRPDGNPPVYDRIANVKAWLRGNRMYFDPKGCPRLIRSVQEHPWAKNTDPPEPQKKWGPRDLQMDHFTDAMGYACCEIGMIRARTGVRFT